MATPVPTPTPQSPVVTSTIRNLTPLALAAVAYALSKANIKIDSTVESDFVSGAVSTVVGAAFTLAGRWLETHKGSWWGRLFIIAKAPAYSPLPAPTPSPTVSITTGSANSGNATATVTVPPLGVQPPTDGTAPIT